MKMDDVMVTAPAPVRIEYDTTVTHVNALAEQPVFDELADHQKEDALRSLLRTCGWSIDDFNAVTLAMEALRARREANKAKEELDGKR